MSNGTEGIQKIMEFIVEGMIIGKKVWADKEINVGDIQHVDEVIALGKNVYNFIQSKPDLGAEFGDIDMVEVIALIQKGYESVQKVEQA